jgi:hypothetical protein
MELARKIGALLRIRKQQFIESLAFPDGRTFRELRRGRKNIFAGYPVELAEGWMPQPHPIPVLRRAGIEPPLTASCPRRSPGATGGDAGVSSICLFRKRGG